MQTLTSLPKLNGARVLVRVDYNVPLNKGKVRDTRRIEASYATINKVLAKGGVPVLMAHLGKGEDTLRPVVTVLSKIYKVAFITHDIFDPSIKEVISAVPKKTVVVLENIRRYPGEEGNDRAFAKQLASLGAYYINDAFSVSHRAHASIVGIPKLLPSFAGVQLEKEIAALGLALTSTKHPFLFILGGAKFETKIPLLKRFSAKADQLVVAGAILNTFYKVAGFEIGNSVTEEGFDAPVRALSKKPNILLPVDIVVLHNTKKMTVTPDEVQKGDVIVDVGPQSIALISAHIAKAKLIVWNGPTGWYEKGFTAGTIALARAIAQSRAHAVIGGGDTGAVIEKVLSKNSSKRIFVSTGGGATLDYLSTGTLPGIKALK